MGLGSEGTMGLRPATSRAEAAGSGRPSAARRDRLQQIMPGGYFSGIGITLVVLLIAAFWLLSGFFRVQSEELGVVLRFGKHVRTVQRA